MYILFIIGRIFLGGFFVYNAFNHFKSAKHVAEYARSKKVPAPHLAVLATGLLILVGGLSVIFNFHVIIGLWLLVIFLVPTTLMMHAFWNEKDPMQKMVQQTQFAKNVAILGAILIMLS
jgi:uncharacterized membrane protein YphA (DoxX/SURF4 family)